MRPILLACALLLPGAVRAAVYDFENAVGPGWSSSARSTTPAAGRGFLGEFGNDAVTLTLGGYAPGATATLGFDLFVLRSWDGENAQWGRDRFRVTANGGTLLDTSFTNVDGFRQAYGSGSGDAPAQAGAAAVDTLGYDFYGDAVYSFTFAGLDVAGGTLAIAFEALGLQGLNDESWGLDNVIVAVTPLPAAALLLGPAVAGLWIARRRHG